MKHSQIKREKDKIQELAREYKKKGYRVIIEPNKSELPDFIKSMDFQPDLIAFGDKENLIFEVKTSATIKSTKEFSRIADSVKEHEGWDFVFVMTNPKKSPSLKMDMEYPSIENSIQYVNKSEYLLSIENDGEFNDMALLAAWSGFEAMIRYALAEFYEKGVEKNVKSLLRDSIMYGVISREDAKFLDSLLLIRNNIAHGFYDKNIKKEKVLKLNEITYRAMRDLEKVRHT